MRRKEHARKRKSVREVGKHARGGQQERIRQHDRKRETVKHKGKKKHCKGSTGCETASKPRVQLEKHMRERQTTCWQEG